MFRIASSCCNYSSTSDSVREDEEDFPMTSPKLNLETTSRGACGDMEDTPPASERLKPQRFRRKDPALHFQACVRGDIHELRKWVKSGGDPNARDGEGWALLHHATVSLVCRFHCCLSVSTSGGISLLVERLRHEPGPRCFYAIVPHACPSGSICSGSGSVAL